MPYMEWSDEFSVKVKELDEQHQHLFKIASQLFDAMKEGKGNKIMKDILTELITYTETHFKTEEKYFEQYDYPDTLSHKGIHAEFRDRVLKVQDEFDGGKISLSTEVMSFLREWIHNHIMGVDKKYSEFLNSRGVS